jgi:acyl-CoA thioester hydrolase
MTSKGEPFVWPLRVYYEDTDLSGVVYYANYLRFMERARTEWLRALGFEMSAMAREHGCHFVVQRAELDYRAPARLDDELVATVSLLRRGHARLVLKQEIEKAESLSFRRTPESSVSGSRLAPGREAGSTLVSGTITLACITTDTWQPTPMPAALAQSLEALA